MGEIGTINQSFDFVGESNWHEQSSTEGMDLYFIKSVAVESGFRKFETARVVS
jgi:hypothetical protein